MGQLNPMRTIAPQQTVSTSALAQILGNQGEAIQGIGKGLSGLGNTAGEFGRQRNTGKLTDLIASGQLEGLNEIEAQQKMLGMGRQSEEGTHIMESLLGGLREDEAQSFKNQMQLDRQEESRQTALRLATSNKERDAINADFKKAQIAQRGDIQGNQVLQFLTGKDGKQYAGYRSGALKDLGIGTPTGSKSGGSAKKFMDSLGLSKEAKTSYQNNPAMRNDIAKLVASGDIKWNPPIYRKDKKGQDTDVLIHAGTWADPAGNKLEWMPDNKGFTIQPKVTPARKETFMESITPQFISDML